MQGNEGGLDLVAGVEVLACLYVVVALVAILVVHATKESEPSAAAGPLDFLRHLSLMFMFLIAPGRIKDSWMKEGLQLLKDRRRRGGCRSLLYLLSYALGQDHASLSGEAPIFREDAHGALGSRAKLWPWPLPAHELGVLQSLQLLCPAQLLGPLQGWREQRGSSTTIMLLLRLLLLLLDLIGELPRPERIVDAHQLGLTQVGIEFLSDAAQAHDVRILLGGTCSCERLRAHILGRLFEVGEVRPSVSSMLAAVVV